MILMNDFKSEPAELRQAMADAVQRVLDSGWYILGSELENFEKRWSEVCGVTFGVGVGNGMDAIEIGLRALGIGPGDEVITTPMTAFATVLAILRSGATPVLADIDPGTALLSVDSAERCVSAKTKAVILVHLYGQMRSMTTWTRFCENNNLLLIEDCAQSHLASWGNKTCGSYGVFGAYSFYPTKNLGAVGDAGMIVTDNIDIAERSTNIRNYGQSIRYEHPIVGMNSRLDEVQAAILSEKLKWLEGQTNKRREIASAYNLFITNPLIEKLNEPEEYDSHVYHLYVVKVKARNELLKHLQKNEIQTLIHYPIPVHSQLPCREIKRDPMGLGFSEVHASLCISLPCHPQMTKDDVRQVIEAVNNFQGV